MPRKTIPIVRYDCSKCPGYCCSYPRIEVKDRDVKRLARHFGLEKAEAEKRFTRLYEPGERILKHRKDEIYGSICRFFDTDVRRCTVYEARPQVCREYPNGNRCGYYDFLKFERKHQEDPDFIPSA
ncbi:MAG: YkgJ family cysteine cluster protein [Burkholderiaceae bacterium]|jgi:Fe-S-cluster containining protein|nr:YkgJ family cysteine cluster protein [Burkholderiales bacterium]MCZ8100476.1 YkgJ family cysteine cluster protein [Burkholderiales bacterium]MCZ8337052.1 YkgJ family cysteine cluster protein [Burkholderiaceae bacterium]